MEIINFDDCLRPELSSQKHYGGMSGNKEHILINGENYFLKYPKKFSNTGKNYHNVNLSYSNSPLSEYIASNIYEMLEIPVHKTVLGISKEKKHVIVACKDFLQDGESLDEFKQIKVSYAPTFENDEDSSGNGCNLKNILKLINENPFLKSIDGVEKHFWTMFFIDSFVGNSDRNNGNWGIIRAKNSVNTISPVYDNGNSFNNKWDDSKFERFLSDEIAFKNEAYIGKVSIFTETGKDNEEHPINPFKVIASKEYSVLNEVISELVPKIYKSHKQIVNFINDIPSKYEGINIISDIQKKFYTSVLKTRYSEVFLPVYNSIKDPDYKLNISFNCNSKIEVQKILDNNWSLS